MSNNNNLKKRPDESFEDYCHRISAQREALEMTWTHIANLINAETDNDFSADKYRKTEKRYLKSLGEDEEVDVVDGVDGVVTRGTEEYTPVYNDRETVTVNYEKGETTSSREIPLTVKQLQNPEELLKAHGFNPNEWDIKTATNAKTTRRAPSGEAFVYASRITVKPKNLKSFDTKDVDNYFKSFNSKNFRGLKINPTQYDPRGEFLEVDIADLHVGLLSYEQETGEDYDVKIARERLERAMSDIYERCRGRKFKRIVLALLGDILHVDNQDGTTTRGTRQDIDTRVTKMFDEALDMMFNVIQSLGRIAPVEVIGIAGNHSETLDYCLYKSLEMAYRNDKNVTFFNTPNPRKFRRYGKVLIGWAHGDLKTKNATEWIQGEASEDWGLSKFREVHMGHLHSLQTNQKIEDTISGLIIRYQPTLVASSAWEHKEGYCKVPKTMMSYLWNEEKGLREIWFSNI